MSSVVVDRVRARDTARLRVADRSVDYVAVVESAKSMQASWQSKSLGDVCRVVGGGTPAKNHKDFYRGDIPWATVRDMRQDVISETEFSISKKAVEASSTNVIPAGNVVIATRVGLGKVCFIERDTAINQDLRGVVPLRRGELSTRFLFWWFKSVAHLIEKEGTGATVKGVKLPFIKSLQISVPLLAEQHRIVAILDEAFADIAKIRANAEKNLRNARELFESQLQAVFTQHGENWVEATIGRCTRFIDYRGKTPMKTKNGLRLITAKNVKMGYLQETPKEFVAPSSYDGWMTRGIPRLGDVLFTTEAPLANVAQLETDEKVVFAQRIIIMQPDAMKLHGTFLKYILLSQPVQQRIHDKGTGATVKGIKASLLKSIEISFPKTIDEQMLLVAKLDRLHEETKHLESIYQQKIATLDELKQSLLDRAFSGSL